MKKAEVLVLSFYACDLSHRDFFKVLSLKAFPGLELFLWRLRILIRDYVESVTLPSPLILQENFEPSFFAVKLLTFSMIPGVDESATFSILTSRVADTLTDFMP